jgi:hypothetical protein
VLQRQLGLREQLKHAGRIDHDHLFFNADGTPIRRLREPYERWHRTLCRLPIRYRKPYSARHSSVSWSLMMGRNPLWVAKQHGHSILTMLTVYAAWTEGALEADVAAIRQAMRGPASASRVAPIDSIAEPSTGLEAAEKPQRASAGRRDTRRSATPAFERSDLAVNLSAESGRTPLSPRLPRHLTGGADGTRTQP